MRLFGTHRQAPVCDERLSHIAFIMDGNGRWATHRGLPRTAGHAKGARVFRKTLDWCREAGIRTATYYAFSSENWKRSQAEIDAIMDLLGQYVTTAEQEVKKNAISIAFIGDLSRLRPDLVERMRALEERSAHHEDFRLNIAISYGGRDEIVRAANLSFADKGAPIDAEDISRHMYTECDPDLLVRTGGELRLSNFLLWQSAYTEFYFTKTLWPAFSKRELHRIIRAYYRRHRRYGGV